MCRLTRIVLVSFIAIACASPSNASSFWFRFGSGAAWPVPGWVAPWQAGIGFSGSGWSIHIGSGRGYNGAHRQAWNKLGQGDWQGARDLFRAAIERRPDDASAWLGLSLARANGGQDDGARLAMRRAVRLDMRFAIRGMPVHEFGPMLRAHERRLSTMAALRPGHWFMVAAMRTLQGDRAGTIRASEQALRFNRYDTDAMALLRLARWGR
jgi:tetratricopeptide (TPR) repeat protein